MWLVSLLVACEPEPVVPVDPCADGPAEGLLCTVAGTGARGNNGDDLPARESWLFFPTYGDLDAEGRFVFVDWYGMRIRRIEPDGTLSTLVGSGLHALAAEGSPARLSPLENPVDVAVAPDGTLFIAELHGARVLKLGADGLVNTYVGSAVAPGYPGYAGDGGPATEAQISEAYGIALGDDGTLYIADTDNFCIRKVTPDGIIDTLAGTYEAGLADGVGSEARFASPRGLDYADGYLYVADTFNHAIRRVEVTTGDVVTLAGDGTSGFAGDGGPAADAQLASPNSATMGPDGLLYVADSNNQVIRRIDPATGDIETLAGQPGVKGFAGEGLTLNAALFEGPNDVIVTEAGDLYVIDMLNSRVRLLQGFLE